MGSMEWTDPAERSSWFEAWSAPGRPFNVGPLAGPASKMNLFTFTLPFNDLLL